MRYLFADCELDTARRKLSRAGATINLQRREFRVLTYLLKHHNRVISKDELAERVWQGAIADATIDTCIKKVRRAVGDTGHEQRIIATRHGVGYELVVPVVLHPDEAENETELPMPFPPASVTVDSVPESSEPASPPAETDFRHCHVCRHFNRAQATFCVRCGVQLVQSCVHCGQVVYLPAEFCSACGQTLGKPVQANASAPSPGGAPQLPGSGVLTGERKVVTILCGGLQTTPGIHTGAELDLLHRQMRTLYTLARREVSRYEGTMQHVAGDRFLAVFGAPVAQEDHAQRAVLAALGLQQQLVASPSDASPPPGEVLALRLGLHTGEVAVGGFDAEDQAMAVAVVGDTTLLATGLQEVAAPGTILCSAATARMVQRVVHVEASQQLSLAGQPVDVYTILRRAPGQAPGVPSPSRSVRQFVGRRQELATLRLLLEQVVSGRGHVVGIVGEPGIGKSRLLDEFRRRMAGRSVPYLEGRCLSYRRETPYHPVLDVLRHACGLSELDGAEAIETRVTQHLQALGMAAEESASYLLHLMGVPAGTECLSALEPQELKTRIYTTVRQLCVQASQRQPLVIAFEDLHWIDTASEELLTSLVEHIAGVPILLLATYRPGYRPPWLEKSYATQLAMQPLTLRDSRRLLQEVFSTALVPDTLVQQLLGQADGNPFFLEELAWTVLEHGVSNPSLVMPNTIQAVLMARIDRLSPAEKHLLQVAAVIGKDVPFPLLQAVADLPTEALHWGLERLQSAEFLYETRLVPTLTYTIKHALIQEVANQSLLHSARQPYHQRIAQALAEQFPEMVAPHPELLAHHYTEAGLEEEAIPYWQQAGQRAVERSANIEAISHFTKGLDLLKALPETPERLQHELTLQLAIAAPLMMLKGGTALEVEHAYTRAYALAQQLGETPQQFSILLGLWVFYFSRGRLQTARELAEQCLMLAQRMQDASLLQDAHLALGSVLLHLGEHVAARTALEQGVALYDPQQDHTLVFSRWTSPGVVCLSRLAWTLWMLGYPEQAVARSREALALAQDASHDYTMAYALHFAGLLHQCRREVQLVQERADVELEISNAHGFFDWAEGGMMLRGWALAYQGAVERGMVQLQQGIDSWLNRAAELGKTQILARLAEVHALAKQTAEALRVLDEALATVQRNGEHHYEAELYRLKGAVLLQSEGQRSGPAGCRPSLSEVEACFRHALDIAHQQQTKSLELRAAMSLARLWQTQGHRVEAYQLLIECYNWFTEGFDTVDLQEAKALLAELQ
jgi:class 3 adenylate cyclase/DNA-binding winged helix-turn-helix (wHTH) protein/tetratricopeptide (TPR) repeat protein